MSQMKLDDFEVVDIKKNPLDESQLLELYAITESYEALFNKRARKYKEMGLKEKNLDENEYKAYLLKDYTFLKRPVFIVNGNIFVGNSSTTVNRLKQLIGVEKGN